MVAAAPPATGYSKPLVGPRKKFDELTQNSETKMRRLCRE
jgi:hypothetical protein